MRCRPAPLLLALLGLLLHARVAEAHIPPPIRIEVTVADEHVRVKVVPSFKVFQAWFGEDPETWAPDAERVLPEALRAKLEAQLQAWSRVQADGQVREGTLAAVRTERFEDHLRNWSFVILTLHHPVEAVPKQVGFAWTHYDIPDSAFGTIDVEWSAYDTSEYPVLRDAEPEYVWHRPRERPAPPPLVLPPPPEPPTTTLPLLAIAVVLLGGVGAWRMRQGPQARMALAVLALGGLAAVPLWQVGTLEMRLPWTEAAGPPAAKEAQAIFAALHRKMYAALDGETEAEIYDRLAESVTGDLLPSLYLDIQQGLILQEEGGAVARVKRVEILSQELKPRTEDGGRWFALRARWRVMGVVGHWGHTHRRVNEYVADLTILPAEGHWKIAEMDVLEESRIEDDGRPPDGD